MLGRPLFRGALAWVALSRSAELLLLTILLTALGAAWLAGLAGLAAPMGAFTAGVLVGESEIRHHAEGEIRPFRDVLMGHLRHEDAAGLGERFEPRRDVDAVAKNIAALGDDVA